MRPAISWLPIQTVLPSSGPPPGWATGTCDHTFPQRVLDAGIDVAGVIVTRVVCVDGLTDEVRLVRHQFAQVKLCGRRHISLYTDTYHTAPSGSVSRALRDEGMKLKAMYLSTEVRESIVT